MGTDRSEGDLRGILVPDPRLCHANLVAKTHGTVPSSYTQAEPRTGPAEPDQDTHLVLQTSGSQGQDGDVEVMTLRSGHVTPEGAKFLWRNMEDGDGTDERKGWDPAQLVTGWDALYWTTGATGSNIRPDCIQLSSGKVLASFSVTTLGVIKASRFDPADGSWTSCDFAPEGAGAGYATDAVALCEIPDGRVVAFLISSGLRQVDAYYTDDEGDNWSEYGFHILEQSAYGYDLTGLRAFYSDGEVLLFAEWDDGVNYTATQWASSSLGTSFEKVVSNWFGSTAEEPFSIDIVPTNSGGFVVTYIDRAAAGGDLCSRILSTAFEPIDDAVKVTIDAGAVPNHQCAWRDDTGELFCLSVDGSVYGEIWRSGDDGATWAAASDSAHVALMTAVPTDLSAVMIAGRVMFLFRWSVAGTTYDPASVGILWLAGFSTHTAPAEYHANNALDCLDSDFVAFGASSGGVPGGLYVPVTVPGSAGWVMAGAGSEAQTAAAELQFTTAAGQTRYAQRTLGIGVAVVVAFYEFAVEIDDGDGSTAAQEIAFRARLSCSVAPPGTFELDFELHLSSAGYRIYDRQAAAYVGAVEAVDFTTTKHVRIIVDADGDIRTWWGSPGHVRSWTTGPTGVLNVAGAYTNPPLVEWGHLGAAANVSRWTLIGYCLWSGRWNSAADDTAAASWANPDDLHARQYSSVDPMLIVDGVRVQGVAGPTHYGETQRIKPAFGYPISSLDPAISASPGDPWRAIEDNQDYAIVWDLESEAGFSDSFWESTSLGCFLVDSTVRTCKFQGWDGAAWQDIVTLDASEGFASLPYIRKGRLVYADTGGAAPSGDRWSPHMMHAGDSILLDDGETQKLRRIETNSEGGWRSGSKLARLSLDSDYLDGTEAASGTATIYRRNFGAAVHNVSTTYRYVRLFIGRQKTYSGYYEIGALAIGPVFVYGLPYGNGWSIEAAPNYQMETADDGSRAARRLGRPRRAWEVGWANDAQDTARMWDEEPYPDYLTGVSGGDPVASLSDTIYQVLGLMERVDGAVSPVVHLGRIPRGVGSHRYTMDPDWLWSRLVSSTFSADHVIGSEGTSPVLRGNKLRFEEEV